MALPQPRDCIAALAPYPLGAPAPPGVSRVIDLANNEYAGPPSQAVQQACLRALEAGLNRYPEPGAAELRAAIAAVHGLDAERIVCANGSSELISLLSHAYCQAGDEVLVGAHSYLFFTTAATIAGATVVRVPTSTLGFDVAAALAAVTANTRAVFVDNPGNPTGKLLDGDSLRELREGLPQHVLLVLDAAYADYVIDTRYEAGESLVDEYDNCVVLRTFSKIYGLAGLRLGWAYASADVAGVLHKVRQPNNLTALTEAAGIAAIGEQTLVRERRDQNARVRERFSERLRELGLKVLPSHTNFVLVHLEPGAGHDAESVYRALRSQGVLVRPMNAYHLPEHLRITIGTQQQMTMVGDLLANVVAGPR